MNRERRAVLKNVAALTGAAVGTRAGVGRSVADGGSGQQVDTDLPPGVTLFDLNDDGTYAARVVAGPEAVRDEAHPRPIHVTSRGRATVDFAASIVEPSGSVTLGDLDRLTYDYYEGSNNAQGQQGDVSPPDQTFLVVENADGRHGIYLTYHDSGATEQWATFDVLARMRGDTAGTSRWFEYTATGGDQTFDDVIERFGADARLVRVGVGHGNAVSPAVLDAFYGNLVVNDETYQFPTSVAKRVSHANPF